MKGKKFFTKNKNRALLSSILSIIMAKSSSIQVPIKKTWLNDGFIEWVYFFKFFVLTFFNFLFNQNLKMFIIILSGYYLLINFKFV